MTNCFEALLEREGVVLLDGATGTELERLGVPAPPPLWTAEAARQHADILGSIHGEYLRAGADLVTANTFRTTPHTLRKLGRANEARDLTLRSVECARAACQTAGHGLVAGSMSPLEDCYQPGLVPSAGVLRAEHAAQARNLAAAGVDLLLVETMNTAREAYAAAEAALTTGLPVLVSFVLDPTGNGDVLSGEELEVAWAQLRTLPVAALLVNCAPAPIIAQALARMTWPDEPRPIGGYANTHNGAMSPAAYATAVRTWLALGARILGGCCYTTPDHIRALHQARQIVR